MAILSLNLKNVKNVVGRRLKPCPNTNVKIILSIKRVLCRWAFSIGVWLCWIRQRDKMCGKSQR